METAPSRETQLVLKVTALIWSGRPNKTGYEGRDYEIYQKGAQDYETLIALVLHHTNLGDIRTF